MELSELCRQSIRDPQQLDAALEACDTVPLLMSLVHLTGEAHWLDRAAPYIKGGWAFQTSIPDDLAQAIRARLRGVLHAIARGELTPIQPSPDLLANMMNTSVGQDIPQSYRAIFYEETQLEGSDPKDVHWRNQPTSAQLEKYQVLVIGAGFSGLAMGIKLGQAGIPYTILEKNREVGGTWHENNYPGVAVDTVNHFYSYSFAPNPKWSRYYSKGSEIQRYILECVERFGIRKRIRFGVEVLEARYDEALALWNVKVRSDDCVQLLQARALVSAVGALNQPSIPNIPGLDTFKGPAHHTARWDTNLKLDGKRVALIGTGASGIQFGPAVAPIVEKLTVFQRSPHWIMYHPFYHKDVSEPVRWAMVHIPHYMRWLRFMLFWAASDGFHSTLKMDPNWAHKDVSLNAENHKLRQELIAYYEKKLEGRTDLMEKAVPKFPPFGKRMLRDTYWLEMLLRPNVELVAQGVASVEPDAVIAADGSRHEVDVIVLATGFNAAKMISSFNVVGRDGTTLRDLWGEDDPRAYLGITHPGFPNFFMIYGPNTNLAHGGSAIFHSECQVHYIMEALRELIERGADAIECRQEPFAAYTRLVDDELKQMVWSHAGVTSWYKNKKGRVIMNSPWRLAHYRDLTAHLNPQDYEFSAASALKESEHG